MISRDLHSSRFSFPPPPRTEHSPAPFLFKQTISYTELGHNFGVDHTHALENKDGTCNPVDNCVNTYDACCKANTSPACPIAQLPACTGSDPPSQKGTIMSYCNLRSGGTTGNINPTFGRNFACGNQPDRIPDRISDYITLIASSRPQCLRNLSPQPPSQPTNLVVGTVTDTTAVVSWTPSSTAGNPPLSTYSLKCVSYLSGCYSNALREITVTNAFSSARVTGLTQSTQYSCYVTANSSGFASVCSGRVDIVTNPT